MIQKLEPLAKELRKYKSGIEFIEGVKKQIDTLRRNERYSLTPEIGKDTAGRITIQRTFGNPPTLMIMTPCFYDGIETDCVGEIIAETKEGIVKWLTNFILHTTLFYQMEE